MEDKGQDGVITLKLGDAQKEAVHKIGVSQVRTKVHVGGTPLAGNTPNADGLVLDKQLGKDTLRVQCIVDTVVHGTMTKDQSSTPATFLVMRFNFHPHSVKERFRDVDIKLTFTAGTVEKIVPYGCWKTDASSMDRKKTFTINPQLGVPLGPLTITLPVGWSLTDESTIEDHVWIQGEIEAVEDKQNTADWWLHENDQTNSGVPTELITAVLLNREGLQPDRPFEALLSITTKVHMLPSDWIGVIGNEIDSYVDGSSQAHNKADASEKITLPILSDGISLYFDPKLPGHNKQGPDATQLENVDLSKYMDLQLWPDLNNSKGQAQTPAQTPAQQVSTKKTPIAK